MAIVLDGTTGVTFPAGGLGNTAGAAVGTTDTQTLTNKTIQGGALTLATAVASTSGTSIDFTGIPSWVKRITVLFSGVSTNSTSHVMVQIGDAGGIETTGYSSAGMILGSGGTVAGVNSTAGFVTFGNAAAAVRDGELTINKLSSSGTSWVSNHLIANPPAVFAGYGSGTKTLSDTLTQVRVTTVNGTDTFDAGTLNIMYEG
jgi:hypothetical protein